MTDKEQVIQALRATLISVKGALTIKQCNRDYKELQGEWIPFKRLGYSSLDKLFLDVPGFTLTQTNNEWYVDAIATQETQHIAAMVAKQKSAKKPTTKYPSRFPKRQGSWRKPVSYTPNYNNQYSNQYYRARGDSTPFNNNYKSVKYNYKTYEPKHNSSGPFKYQSKLSNAKDYNTSSKEYNTNSKEYNTNSKEYNTNSKEYNTNSKEYSTNSKEYNTSSKDYNTNSKDERLRDYTTHSKMKNSIPVSLPSHQNQNKVTYAEEHNAASRVSSNENNEKPSGKVSASQRLSNLRDRLNTASDCIPLQLPAASNEICVQAPVGAVSHVAPAHELEPPPDTASSVLKLDWTCKKLGLEEPVYKVHNMPHSKHGPGSYCSVKVGTVYNASSYPASSPSEELARELAAAKVLAEVEKAEAAGVPTSEPAAALHALADLVAECEAGLWATTVPHIYREKYGENLPSNWQELVENCPRIIKDRLVNGLFVLLPNKEGSAPRAEPAPAPGDLDLDSDLPMLQFPQEQYWNVHVTVANSPIEIWVRIIGPQYSEQLVELLNKMSEFYEHGGTSIDPSMLIKNGWYAVKLDEAGWQRAKVLDVDEDCAAVFLGDHGDDDLVPLQRLRILEPQFRKLPAQGVLCRLEGAEELAASAQGAELVQRRLSGEVLVAAPGPRADPLDPSVPLVLYDTSTSHDLNLNKEIVEDFCIAAAFTLSQKPCEVEVGCVTEEGRVWVARAGGAATVRAALDLLTAGPYRRPLPPAPPAPPPHHHALYIVRTLAGDWVRCSIISGLDGEGTVRTQLVDSGLILRAPLSALVPLQTFSPALNQYPRQAVQVRLGAAERAAGGMVPRLRELLLDTRVVCRALPPAAAPAPAGAAPHVELFVRTGPQNILASVNNAILMEYDYLQLGKMIEEVSVGTNPVEALNKKKERIFRSASSGAGSGAGAGDERAASALPPPALPALDMCFDVHVAMAANPWNFVVQPNSTRNTLQTMMATLQAECPKLSEADAPSNPASGELYTVFYDKDSSWYRVTVAGCVSTEMVSVYFCDFGDLALFAAKDLRPMPPGAPLARSLPPQALKARLYDVSPLHQDWTVEDCVRFQELCVEQQFVGICKDIGKDPLNPSEPLLTLDLIDTSTDEDVYLNQQLVSEGRARLASASLL